MRYLAVFKIVAFFLFWSCNDGGGKKQAAPSDQIDSLTGMPIAKPNPWVNATCTLITDEDVEAVFDINAKEVTLNTRSLPDQAFCLRTWNKPDWKERELNNERQDSIYLDPQNRLILQVFNYHTIAGATAQWTQLEQTRRNVYEEEVPDLGEKALWSTSSTTLLIKTGHLMLQVSLEYQDVPHENLGKAKEIAAIALERMISKN